MINDDTFDPHLKLTEQLVQFKSAVESLREALDEQETKLERDGCIQRFEFCVDLSWKLLKTYLLVTHSVECNSPRTCIRESFAVELITNDDPFWLEMLEMRNITTHTYKESLAQEVYAKLPAALERFDTLLKQISSDALA